MKIRFKKTVAAVIEKTLLKETWEKAFYRGDEIQVADVFVAEGIVTIKTPEGDYILMVPPDSFERVAEQKKPVLL